MIVVVRRSTASSAAAACDVFLCPTCHAKSTCRSEVHIDIAMKRCEACGHYASCFGCKPGTGFVRKAINTTVLIPQYRNTRQLKPYKNIDI